MKREFYLALQFQWDGDNEEVACDTLHLLLRKSTYHHILPKFPIYRLLPQH